jgi:hypothetical protein
MDKSEFSEGADGIVPPVHSAASEEYVTRVGMQHPATPIEILSSLQNC